MTIVFSVREVRINKSGYDSRGQYWGIGKKLYEWTSDTEFRGYTASSGHFRADSREDAKQRIRDFFKTAGEIRFQEGFRTVA